MLEYVWRESHSVMGLRMQMGLWGLAHSRAGMSCFGLVFCRNQPRCEEFSRSRKAQRRVEGPRPCGACSPPPVASTQLSASLYSAPRVSRLLEGRDAERGSYVWWQMDLCVVWASVTKSGLSPADWGTSTGVVEPSPLSNPRAFPCCALYYSAYDMCIRCSLPSPGRKCT